MIKPGDTFFGRLFPEDRTGHLYIAVANPDLDDAVAVVNFTTHRPGFSFHNESCVLFEPPDHPFLNRPSCVASPLARLRAARAIEAEVEIEEAEPREPLRAEVLRRVQDAALASPDVPQNVKAAIRDTLAA